MNEQNLIPTSERSKNEVREIGSKGGKKSGEIRRRQRDMKNSMKFILSQPAEERAVIYNQLVKAAEADPTLQDEMLAALLGVALTGDVPAIKQVREIIRDDDRLKIEQERLKLEKKKLEQNDDGLDKLDEILDRIRGADDDKNTV